MIRTIKEDEKSIKKNIALAIKNNDGYVVSICDNDLIAYLECVLVG